MRICSLRKKKVSVVRIKSSMSVLSGLNLGKMYGLSPGTKKTVCTNEVSIMSGCP